MRPLAKAAAIGVVAAVILIAAMFILLPMLNTFLPEGFSEDDLVTPDLTKDSETIAWTGRPVASVAPDKDYSMRWWITPVHEGFGGSLNITLKNTGNTNLHIYEVGIEWPDYDIGVSKTVNINISKGSSADLGVIYFPAPSNVTTADYILVISMSAQNRFGAWWDYGEISSSRYDSDILPLGVDREYKVTENPVRYFDRVNDLVDPDEVQSIVNSLDEGFYSFDIQEVVSVFDWVRENIAYADDPNDDWQSPKETLQLRSGDCEDQAIMLCSMISALGGTSRINLIEGHAFATVYVGDNASTMQLVQDAIGSHYALDVNVFFLVDELGIWLIIDTTSYHYCGGMPTLSVPTGTGMNDFAFEETDWLYTIDVVE